MSEKLPHRPEASSGSSSEVQEQLERLKDKHEKGHQARHEHAEKLQEIRETAKEAAASHHEVKKSLETHDRPDDERPMIINNELKAMAYRRTLRRVRGQLPMGSRALSKVIHAPGVEAASELAGRTVARPSGILSGGIAAFLGSSVFLWIARHYGYEYNFLLFALLFVGGFFVGLLVELLVRVLFKGRRGRRNG